MQFIDQAPAYSAKSITLDEAVKAGRARLSTAPGSEKLVYCFRPALDVATAFDNDINKRVKFDSLSTPEKLDLLITELLPGFYHPENLPHTGRTVWVVHFLIDGQFNRTVVMDANGLHDDDNTTLKPSIEVETDIMTLMAILRSVIAGYHTKKLKLGVLPDDSSG